MSHLLESMKGTRIEFANAFRTSVRKSSGLDEGESVLISSWGDDGHLRRRDVRGWNYKPLRRLPESVKWTFGEGSFLARLWGILWGRAKSCQHCDEEWYGSGTDRLWFLECYQNSVQRRGKRERGQLERSVMVLGPEIGLDREIR